MTEDNTKDDELTPTEEKMAKVTVESAPIDVPLKKAWYWVKKADGTPSASATFAFVAFWVTTVAYILSLFEKVGPITVRPFDAVASGAYLTPVLMLYFGRRYTESSVLKK